MPDAPFNVYSSRVDPSEVLLALEAAGAHLEIREGTREDWRVVQARWPSDRLFDLRHDPASYSGDTWSKQLPGMFSYFLRAGAPLEVLSCIRALRFNVSLTAAGAPLGPEDPRFDALGAVCERLDGVVFVPGGFRDAAGRWLFRLDGTRTEGAQLPRPAPPHPMLSARGALYDARPTHAVRSTSCQHLAAAGFATPYALPMGPTTLRPVTEIAHRLLALRALFFWVARPDRPDAEVVDAIRRDGLHEALTESENEVLNEPRDQARSHVNSIGWRLENMWPLAWVLGFEPPPLFTEGMMGAYIIEPMFQFMPPLSAQANEWLRTRRPRPVSDVIQLEDTYYCAHHCVRSAQQGRTTVPAGFHPVSDGGVIHERRHALTWCLSPTVTWDETSLAT